MYIRFWHFTLRCATMVQYISTQEILRVILYSLELLYLIVPVQYMCQRRRVFLDSVEKLDDNILYLCFSQVKVDFLSLLYYCNVFLLSAFIN